MAKTTTAQLLVKPVQYIAETTEGTIPTTGSCTVFGAVDSVAIKKDGNYVEVGQLGPEDLLALVTGQKTYETQWKMSVTDITLISRAINAANYGTPAGTVSETISIVLPIYLNGVANYIVFKGSRPKDITYTKEVGKEDKATVSFSHMSIVAPSTSAPSGLTLSSTFPSGAIFDWLSGGANPVSWNGSALDCKKISITINRNTKPDHTLGNEDPYSTQPHGRRIGGDFSVLWTVSTLEADYDSKTARTLAIVLKTAAGTLTCSNAKITNYSRDLDVGSDEGATESCNYKCLSAAVA